MNSRTKLAALGLAAAVPVVMCFEGLRQKVYLDPVGIPTACFGHTGNLKMGQTFTQAECQDLLAADLLKANATVDACVRVPLAAHQRSALVSFTYNVGHGAPGIKDGFCTLKSGTQPTLLRKLNAGDYAGACAELPKWASAKGVKLPGLVKRRDAERALCLGLA